MDINADRLKYLKAQLILATISKGDTVTFEWNNLVLKGKVLKINSNKIKVESEHRGNFGLSPDRLTKVHNE